MKTTQIEEQLRDKSHKELHETFEKMFAELYRLYDKYGKSKNQYLYLKQNRIEMSFPCLDDFQSNIFSMIKEDIADRMVEVKTKDLLDKLELL